MPMLNITAYTEPGCGGTTAFQLLHTGSSCVPIDSNYVALHAGSSSFAFVGIHGSCRGALHYCAAASSSACEAELTARQAAEDFPLIGLDLVAHSLRSLRIQHIATTLERIRRCCTTSREPTQQVRLHSTGTTTLAARPTRPSRPSPELPPFPHTSSLPDATPAPPAAPPDTQLLKRSAQGAAGLLIFLLVVVAPLTFWCTIRRQTARRAKHRSKAVELIWSESDVLADSTRGGFGGGGGGGGGSQHELEMYELNDAAKAARDGELDEFDYAK